MPTQSKDTARLVGLALNIGWQIAIPLVVCALAGRMIDRVWHTTPLFFLMGVIISLLLSSWLVVRIVSRVITATADTHTDIKTDKQ
ncbi:MAG: AtpZ/AtpI family protein [bacterium]|nr:AtpZ/AtpI family protein [bacterium]